MVPNEIKFGAQYCFDEFAHTLFRSKFFFKAVSVLLLSFALSHFHKSSPTFLQEIYFLVSYMPNKWKLSEMNVDLDLDLNLDTF